MSTATLTEATKSLGNALIEALGLPQNVTRLRVALDPGKPPVVKCEYLLVKVDGSPINAVKGCFHLVEIDNDGRRRMH